MYRAMLTKVAKPAAKSAFRYAGRIPQQIFAGYKSSSSRKANHVSAIEFLSGGGSPSVSELASLMANVKAAMACSGRPRSLIQRMLDSVTLQLWQLYYEIYFLILRMVGMIVGYAFCVAVMYGIFYFMFLT
jgi:hypothetical protein